MSDRSVSVRLRLLNAEYRKGMAEATGDTNKLAAAAKGAFAGLGDQLKQVGDGLTRRVTLPLVGLGAVATKLGMDFETTFAHMVGLANVPAAEIDGLKQSVLALSHATARSPQELAEALYYIRSSGISAAKSLDVLNVAGQAAAAGLGSTQDIARAVGFAINAYGENNLSAAKATDVLVATIREGTIEAGDLAPVMGRLIPTAAALGISFEQVAGTMAVMSKNGASADDAATGLSAVMSTLLNTSSAGADALAAHGLSLKQLRDIASGPGGLVAVFRTLDTTFQGNDEALATVIPNIRALRTFMNVLSQDATGVDKTLQAVTSSAGATAAAFAAVKDTKAFQIKQDLNDAKVALVELGAALAPAVAALAGVGAAFIAAFGKLPTWLEGGVAGIVGLLVVIGPLVSIAGRLAANWELLAKGGSALASVVSGLRTYFQTAAQFGATFSQALGSLAREALTAAAPMIALTAVVGAAALVYAQYKSKADEAAKITKDFTAAILEAGSVGGGAMAELTKKFAAGEFSTLQKALRNAGISVAEFAAAITEGGPKLDELKSKLASVSGDAFDIRHVSDDVDKLADSLGGAANKAATTASVLGKVKFVNPTASLGDIHAAEGALASLGDDTLNALRASAAGAAGGMGGLGSSIAGTGNDAILASAHLQAFMAVLGEIYSASFDVLDSSNAWRNSLDDVTSAASTTGGATRDLTSEQRSLEKATKDVTKAQQGLADAEAALAEARKGPTDREKVDAGLGVREANLGLKDAQLAVTDAQKRLNDERKKGKDGDVKGATLALEHAQLNLTKAQLAVTDAQKNQNDVMTSGEETSKKVKDAVDAVTVAQDQLVEANQRVADAEDALTKGANGGPVADKHRAIKAAIDQSVTAGDAWIKKLLEQKRPAAEVIAATDEQRTAVQKLIDTYGDPDGKLKKFLDYLLLIKTLQGAPLPPGFDPVGIALGAAEGKPAPTAPATALVPARAGGGPTVAGETYKVGEHGVELWTAGASGFVTPNDKVAALTTAPQGQLVAASSMAGAPMPTITITPSVTKVYIGDSEVGYALVRWSHDIGGARFKVRP